MKKYFAFLFLLFSSYSWGCILIKGEVKINSDSLKVHQKFNLNEDYPYRTENYIVHIRLRSAEHLTRITVKHPKTLKTLLESDIQLKADKETNSHFSHKEIELTSRLTLKNI
ncbi:MAG TPA: hypothetical protein VKZ84_05885 [Bacteriovoracaceae bacterium]|nr:hypothetical protein [Bacteriovoracaceae bacterium]